MPGVFLKTVMEDDHSHSFLGSLIRNLSSALSDHKETEIHKVVKTSNILDSVMNDLDWMETDSSNDNQDLKNSMNFHKRILDSEIDTIDKELDSILKNKDTVDYLISLLKKREKLETQIHQIEEDLHIFQKEG